MNNFCRDFCEDYSFFVSFFILIILISLFIVTALILILRFEQSFFIWLISSQRKQRLSINSFFVIEFEWENRVEISERQNKIDVIEAADVSRRMIDEDTVMTMNLIIEVSLASVSIDFLLSIEFKIRFFTSIFFQIRFVCIQSFANSWISITVRTAVRWKDISIERQYQGSMTRV